MATQSWATVIDQSTDATFRVWGLELSTKFGLVGMVQTADTGQINWATVTRAAGNTAAGYEIWKLSSGNLFFKIEYGSGTNNAVPSIWLTVGTGSNGSGTITGQVSTRSQCGATNSAITSTVTLYQSYLCATANYFGLAWKVGSATTANKARNFMGACQTVDNTGAASTVGYFMFALTSGAVIATQCVATTAGVVGVLQSNANFIIIPNNSLASLPSSQDGAGNNQSFVWWYSILGTTPMTPLLHVATILPSDLTFGNTASMTIVGSIAHTYISIGIGLTTDAAALITANNLAIAMLFE